MIRITIADPKTGKYYRAEVTARFVERYDNGAIVSCGLTVGEYGLSLDAPGIRKLEEIPKEDWNHSGCQSSCVKRGGKECRW